MDQTQDTPLLPLSHLDVLWFQVAGTVCNLSCHHCFISCTPTNDSFGNLTLEQVKSRLEESVSLGVKEYYFTGGETFLNPEIVPILIETLKYGPATVLTNGTAFRDSWLQDLQETEAASIYSLEFRVSIDGFSPETNDPIRGQGTFKRAMRGVQRLVEFGFLPIITATRTWPEDQELTVLARFVTMLQEAGYPHPRLKILPTLQLGAEENRTHGYRDSERVTSHLLKEYDTSQLLCEHSRIVTDRGVHVCPILIESSDALLSSSLKASLSPFELKHGACYTCYLYGAICSNSSISS